MASVAEIAPLSTEFNMPGQQTQAKDAVTKEIEKLGEVTKKIKTELYFICWSTL